MHALGAQATRDLSCLLKRLPVSRPAVSQHLKVLKGVGLVVDRPEGTQY